MYDEDPSAAGSFYSPWDIVSFGLRGGSWCAAEQNVVDLAFYYFFLFLFLFFYPFVFELDFRQSSASR